MGKPSQNFRKEGFELAKEDIISYGKSGFVHHQCSKYAKEGKRKGCINGITDFFLKVIKLEYSKEP
jgi:hypothetical protein